MNLTYDPLGPIVTQATEPPTEFLATKADLHMTLAWQAPTLFVDGSRIPRGTKIRYRVYRDKAFIAEVTEPFYEEEVPEWDRAYIYVVYAVVTGRPPEKSDEESDEAAEPGASRDRQGSNFDEEGSTSSDSDASSAVIPAEAGIQGQAAENSAADGEEVEFVSDPSEATELYFAPLLAALPPGEFEPPSLVSSSGLTAALPKAAVAKFGDKYYTHMVYLVRGDNDQGDRIDYLRSEKSGARDSFSHLVKGVADPGDGWTITEVSIAARENKVVIAWVEKTKEREPLFRIRVSDSRRNGDSFQALPHPVVGGTAWTRDLDTALDHRNRHHMVWSEANKVYYALDYVAETDPETDGDNRVSVFDVKKRRVNRDVVRYKHNYSGEDCKDVCGCPKSVAESYTLGLEKREGQELGKYHTRIEETFVYQPSLHVDGDKITIAARQTRMFDNYTYVNPNWRGSSDIKWTKNLGPKVPGGRRTRIPDTNRYKWCPPPPGATAWQPGYRHAWKLDQYKCEPEIPSNAEELLRLESRDNEYRYKHRDREDYYTYTENFGGHEQSWYYYLYEGKWHEEDSLKVAQRPLNRGAWSEPKTYATWEEPELWRGSDWVRMREQENVVVEEGFAVGTWKRGELDVDPSSRPEWAFANLPEYEETRQRWRISTVETFASLGPEVPEEECAQSDPHVASLPGRKLVGPSYPKTYTGPEGTVYLVYEKGDAFHANVPGGNPIYFRKSNEDGVEGSWSSPKQIGQGFLPDISVASDGEIGVVYYVPDADAPLPDPQTGRQQLLGSLRITRSTDGGSNWVEETLNLAPTKPAHWSRYDGSQLVTDESGTAYSDYYHGIPDVVSFEEMLFVAWVRQAQSTTDRDAIVTTRMARTTEGRRVEHKTVSQGVAGESVAMTSVVVNKFHIRIPSDGSEELSGAALASSTSNTNGASVHSGASTDTSTATSPAVVPAEAGIQAQTTSGSGSQSIRSTTHEALAGQTRTETEAALGQSLPAEAFHNGVFSGVAPVQVALQTQAAGGWQELDGVEETDLEQIALLVEIKELFGKALGLENRAERMRKEMEAQAGYYTEEERAKWEEIRQRMLAEAQEKTEQADALCEEVHKREGTTPRDKKDPCGDVRWQMVSREERVLATADYLTEEEKAMFCRDEWMCVVIGKPIALGPDGQGVDASLGSDTVIASAGAAIPASQEQGSQQELLDKNFAYFASNQEVVPNNATGNYYWATKLRDDQIRQKGGGEGFEVLQVEYQPDPLRKEETEVLYDSQYLDTLNVDEQRLLGYRAGIEHDAKFLVSFERVWAYTMGIAVAQYARRNETVNAHGAARWLCSEVQAVWGTQDGTKSELSWAEAAKAADVLLLGWPFSINTNGDGWRDARLVAGATAWAIHGLGAFMVSRAFRKLVPEEQQQFRDCYYKSLKGLSLHERVFTAHTASGALEVSLMTAGWTAKGLENSETPLGVLAGGELVEEYDENTTPQALQERFLQENPRGGTAEQYAAFVEKERKTSAIASDEKWDYYDILDAIGYYVDEETFNNYPPPKIRTFTRDGQGNRHDQELVRVLNYQQMLALQARSQAENVVTEHNLDTLSVLNHALEHVETIWSNESAEEIASRKAWLKGWRDRQQRGIFEVLWDDSVATEVKQPVRDFETKELIPGCRAEAKTIERKGRVTTGGGFEGGFTQAHLIESEEVAIDNCSWLALSVNYEHGLPEEYKQKLAVCLQYTIDKFADYLPFGDNNQCYYGTHYFPNSFRDPYIEQSDQQELSYHLEASAGLVMGLLWFADAHPEHPSSDAFRAEAMMLWSGMQEFVRDHRFPYSSQRIVNLSTLLTSSTAIIWFIDVFDYLELQDEDYDRPLRPYDEGVDYEQMAGFPPFAFDKLQGMEYEAPAVPTVGPDGKELDEAHAARAPPSPLLVSGQTAEGVLYTLAEDQALALLAAISQQDQETAKSWAQALLGIMRRESQNKAYFPFAVDTTTGEPLVLTSSEDSTSSLNTLVTGTQGLVVYALSHYAAYSGGASKEVGDAIRHTLNRLAQEKSTSSGAAIGAGAGSPNARILDHLYLYFALEAVVDNKILGGSNAWLTTWQQEVHQSLEESFWDGTSHRPKVSLPEGAITEADFFAASSLYTLFAMASGNLERGQDALDSQLWGSTTKRSASGTVPNTASEFIAYHRDAFARSEAAQILALRAVSVLDPRLAQLASAKLSQAIASANSIPAELRTPAVYASLILASAPRGAFGVDGGDLPLAESNVLARLAEAELDVEDLKRLYVETVGALFATDYSHGRFDALVLRLSYVRFLESQLGFPEHPKDVLYTLRREFTPVIAQTVAELRNLCNPNVPSQVRNDRLEELETYLGLQCQTIQENFVKLSTRRAGTPDANVAIVVGASDALVGSGKKAWADRHVAQIAKLLGMFADRLESSDIAYHAQDGVFGYTGAAGLSTDPHTTWKSLATQAPIEFFTDSPNDIEVRTKVRGYLKQAVSATLASVQGTAYYELRHVDPVAAFHPKSLTFWSREAIELRILTQQADAAQYLLADAPVEAPSVDLSGLANSRALRKFTHTYAESHVPILSQATKVPVYALHRMLRTGVLPQEMQQALVSAYPIHEDEAAAWLAEMITPGPGTQGGGFATKALGLALKHNLPGFLSGVGLDFVGALFSVSLNGEQTDAAGELNAQIQASAAEQDVAQKIQWLDAIGIEFDHEVATSIMLQWYPIAKEAILPNLLFRDDDYFSTVEELIAGKVKGFEPPKQYVDAVAVALEKGEEAPSSHLFDFDPQIWLVDHECPTLSELAEAAKVYQVEFRLEFHVPSRHCVVGTGSGERFSTPFLVALGLPDLRHASLLIAHTHVGATPPSKKDQEFISTLSQGPLAQENSLLIAGGTVTVYSASSIGTPLDIVSFEDAVLASATQGLPTDSSDSTTNEPPGSFVPEAKQNSWKAHEQRLQENLELYAPKLQQYQQAAQSQMLDKTSEQSKQLARYAELVTTLEQLRNAATQYLNMFAVGDYLATADANVLAAINAEYGKQDTQRTTTLEELQALDETLSSAFPAATATTNSAGVANIRYELPGDDSEQGTKQVDEDTCVDIIRWDAGKRHKSGYLQLPRTQFVSWTPGARSAEVAKSAPGFTVLAKCHTANGTYTDSTYTRFFLEASAGFEPYYAVLVRKKDAPIASGVTAKGTVEVPKDVVGNPTGATTTSPLVTSTVTNAATELECHTGYGVTLEDELCLPKVVDSGNILSGLVQTAATDGASPPSNNPLVRIAELMQGAQAIRDAVAQISATTLEYYDVYTPEDFARATALVTQQLAIAKEKQTEANGLCLEVLQQRKITPKDPDKPCDDVPWQEQAEREQDNKEKTIEEILADHEALGVHYDRQVATAMMKKGKVSLDDRDLPWFRSPTTILKVKAKRADWFEFSGGCLSLQEDCMSPGEELFLWLEECPTMEELEKAAESAEIELNLYFDFGTRHCFLKRQNYPPIQTVRYTTNAPNAQEKFLPVWLAYTVGDAFVDSATSLERKAFAERAIGQTTIVAVNGDQVVAQSLDGTKQPSHSGIAGMTEVTAPITNISFEKAEVEIPEWIKNNADWWADGLISDDEFVKGIEILIANGVLKVPTTTTSVEPSERATEIPDWIKNNAGWWADGLISDSDFLKGIQFLMENGIVSIDTTGSSSGGNSAEEEILAGHEALGIHYDKAAALAMMEKGAVTLDDPATIYFQRHQRSTTILKVQAKQVKWAEYAECPANAGCRGPGADMFVWLDACPSMEELDRAAERNDFELNLYYDFATRRCFLKRQNYPRGAGFGPPYTNEKFLPIWVAYTTASGYPEGATHRELGMFAERPIGQTTILAVQDGQATVQSLKDGTPITNSVGSGSTPQGVHLAHCLADEQLVPTLNSSNTQAEYVIDRQRVSVTVKPMKSDRSKEWFGWRDAPQCASGLKWTPKRQGVPDEEHIPLWVLQDLAHHELAVFETTTEDCGAEGAGFAVVTSGRSDSVALNSPEIRAFLNDAPGSKLVGHMHVDKRATIFPSRWDYGFLFERSKKNGQKTSLIYPKEGNYAYEFGLSDTNQYEPEKWAKACEDWRYKAIIEKAEIDPSTNLPQVKVWYDTNGKELDLEIAIFDDANQKVLAMHRVSVDDARTQTIELPNWTRPPEQDYYLVWVNLVDPGVECTRACTGEHYARDEGMHLYLGGENVLEEAPIDLSQFKAENLELLAHMPVRDLVIPGSGDAAAGSIWGWRDPQTSKEYVLIATELGSYTGQEDCEASDKWKCTIRGVAVVDISDAKSPQLVGIMPSHNDGERNIRVYKNHAYVVGESQSGMLTYDLTKVRKFSDKPILIDHIGQYRSKSWHGIAIHEETGHAYLLGQDAEGSKNPFGRLGIHAVNIKLSPSGLPQAVFAGEFNMPESGSQYIHDAQVVIYQGPDTRYRGKELAFSSSPAHGGPDGAKDRFLIIDVDVSDKQDMQLVSESTHPELDALQQGQLTEDHRYFLSTDMSGRPGYVQVWDVQDLENPVVLGAYKAGRSWASQLYIRGNHVFQANYKEGLYVYDLNKVASGELRKIASLKTLPGKGDSYGIGAIGVYPLFSNGVVAVSDTHNGLFLVRVASEAYNPQQGTPVESGQNGAISIVADDGVILRTSPGGKSVNSRAITIRNNSSTSIEFGISYKLATDDPPWLHLTLATEDGSQVLPPNQDTELLLTVTTTLSDAPLGSYQGDLKIGHRGTGLFPRPTLMTVSLAVDILKNPGQVDASGDGTDAAITFVTLAEGAKIPDWIKTNAGWWAEDLISAEEFVKGIEFLIANDILVVPPVEVKSTGQTNKIPDWIKNNAGWWADGLISDSDFLKGIEFLMANGIVRIETSSSDGSSTSDGDRPVVSVMVRYSQKAREAAGSKAAIEKQITDALDSVNGALDRSAPYATLEIVGNPKEVPENVFADSGDAVATAIAVRGMLDDVAKSRATLSADAVLWVVEKSFTYEKGPILEFASEGAVIAQRKYLDQTIVHGFGHFFGCKHGGQQYERGGAKYTTAMHPNPIERERGPITSIFVPSDHPTLEPWYSNSDSQFAPERDRITSTPNEYCADVIAKNANRVSSYNGKVPENSQLLVTPNDKTLQVQWGNATIVGDESFVVENNSQKQLDWLFDVYTETPFSGVSKVPLEPREKLELPVAVLLDNFGKQEPGPGTHEIWIAFYRVLDGDAEWTDPIVRKVEVVVPGQVEASGDGTDAAITFVTLAEGVEIPSWIKTNAGWWAEDLISADEFVKGIEFLIANDILVVPPVEVKSTGQTNQIPDWIKNNAGWWAEGLISDSDFLKGIEFLIKEGIISVGSESNGDALPKGNDAATNYWELAKAFPIQACGIRYSGEHQCSATLVDSDKLLTAASCVSGLGLSNSKPTVEVKATCGTVFSHGVSDWLEVKEVELHSLSDVALLTLKQPVSYGYYIRVAATKEEIETLLESGRCATFPLEGTGYRAVDALVLDSTTFAKAGSVRGIRYDELQWQDLGAGLTCLANDNELVYVGIHLGSWFSAPGVASWVFGEWVNDRVKLKSSERAYASDRLVAWFGGAFASFSAFSGRFLPSWGSYDDEELEGENRARYWREQATLVTRYHLLAVEVAEVLGQLGRLDGDASASYDQEFQDIKADYVVVALEFAIPVGGGIDFDAAAGLSDIVDRMEALKDKLVAGKPITDAVGSGSPQGLQLAHCLADEQLVPTLNSSNTRAEYDIDGQKVSVTVKPMKSDRNKEWFGWRDAPKCASGLKWTPKRQGVPDEEHIPLWVLQNLAHHELAVFETTTDDCGVEGAGFAVVTSGRSDSVALNSPEIRAFLNDAPGSKLVGHMHVDKRATIFPSRWDYGFLFERSKKNGQKTSLIYPKEGNYAYEFGLADTDRYEPEKWATACEDWRYTAEIVEAKIDPNTGKPAVTVTYDTNGKALDLEIVVFDDSKQKVLSHHRESVNGAQTQAIPLSNWNRPPEQDYYLVWVNLVDPGVGCTRACTGKHYARDEGMHLHLGGENALDIDATEILSNGEVPGCLAGLSGDSFLWKKEEITVWDLNKFDGKEVAIFTTPAADCGQQGVGYVMMATSGKPGAQGLNTAEIRAFREQVPSTQFVWRFSVDQSGVQSAASELASGFMEGLLDGAGVPDFLRGLFDFGSDASPEACKSTVDRSQDPAVLSIEICKTWDGRPADADEHAMVHLRDLGEEIEIRVEAPFHGDPPPPHDAGPTPKLYDHEVVELFLLGDDNKFLEIELGPFGHSLALLLEGPRNDVLNSVDHPLLVPLEYKTHKFTHGNTRWTGTAVIPKKRNHSTVREFNVVNLLPLGISHFNAYAIHGVGEERRYLAHNPTETPEPDFHVLEKFVKLPQGVVSNSEAQLAAAEQMAGNKDDALIPTWVRNNAKWWKQGTISERQFWDAISFLVRQGTIGIGVETSGLSGKSLYAKGGSVPEWVKTSIGWWGEGQTTDADFVGLLNELLDQKILEWRDSNNDSSSTAEVIADFDNPSEDREWSVSPTGAEIGYETHNGSRALVYKYPNLVDGRNGDTGANYQVFNTVLPKSTRYEYVSFDVHSVDVPALGSKIFPYISTLEKTDDSLWTSSAILSHGCTRVVVKPGTGIFATSKWDVEHEFGFYVYAPEGYEPHGKFPGYYAVDNILGVSARCDPAGIGNPLPRDPGG